MKNKLGHKTLSALLTVGVLAAALLLNLLATWIAQSSKQFYIDLTVEKFNEISEESKSFLKEVDASENHFTIYFLADQDELQSATLGYSNSYTGSTSNLWGMKYIWELAQVFADTYDYVQVETLNLKKDLDVLNEFRTTVATSFTKQNIIVDNYTYETGSDGSPILDEDGEPIMHHNFRVYSRDSFFVFDDSTSYVYAFQGDLTFTSALLSLAGANPTVYFVVGHGEDLGDGTTLDDSMNADYGKASALRDLFFRAGFVTKKIDLQTEYTTLFEDDSARVLVIFGPQEDYAGNTKDSGKIDEISVIRKFLNREDHHLMTFLDETENELTNLEEYLLDYWGITFVDALVKDTGTNSLTEDGLTFVSEYETDEYSVGVNLTSQLSSMSSSPSAIFPHARIIELSDAFTQSSGFYEETATTYAGSVFNAPSTSLGISYEGEYLDSYTEGKVGSVMAFCYESQYTSNNEEVSTYALFCGTTDFAGQELLNSTAYCNSDVLYVAMRIMGREEVPFDIDFKVVQGEDMSAVTETGVITWTVCLCTLIPLAMLIGGTVVFIKRRHS